MARILIRNGRILDPSQGLDRKANLLIDGDRIETICDSLTATPTVDKVIDATDRLVVPGLIDLGTQLREPGFEEDETIASGARAAIAGGFTSIACAPNTEPPVDSQASVEFVRHQASRINQAHVFVLACVSKGREGKELSEMGVLSQAGAIGFSDANRPVSSPELMRRALEYTQMFDRPILNRAEVLELNRDGVMHEGYTSTLLGLPGMPAEAEDVMTARDIRLAEATGGRLHLLHVSTSGSCEQLRRARARGVDVTAGICALNFSISDKALARFDSACKVNPPLRSDDHVQACVQGLVDGTLDVICSGHSPRAAEKKMDVILDAPFGTSSLETTLGLVGVKLVFAGHLDWMTAIEKLSTNPAKVLGLKQKGTLVDGADADVTVIAPDAIWTVEPTLFESKSKSTPLAGWQLHGRATDVIVSGQIKRTATRA